MLIKKNAGEKIVFVKLGNKKDKQLKSEIKKIVMNRKKWREVKGSSRKQENN